MCLTAVAQQHDHSTQVKDTHRANQNCCPKQVVSQLTTAMRVPLCVSDRLSVRLIAGVSAKSALTAVSQSTVAVRALTIRTTTDRLSVRLTAAVIAKPAKPALTGSTMETSRAVAKTTVLLMKSTRRASHLLVTCNQQQAFHDCHADFDLNSNQQGWCVLAERSNLAGH